MNIYPVTIPTLCRYEHFKKCVESLSRCKYANQTELVIGLDYPANDSHVDGYNKIKAFIPNISGFKMVTVFERPSNYGCSRNSGGLREYVFSKYDATIVSEDDNVFSPCFLEFMNKALNDFADDDKIASVCGYSMESYNIAGIKENCICTYDNSAWGLGLWRKKDESMEFDDEKFYDIVESWKTMLEIFCNIPITMYYLLFMKIRNQSYGDVKRTTNNILNRTYQLRPKVSLVRNIGNDGTGENCHKVKSDMLTQNISQDDEFPEIVFSRSIYPKIRSAQFFLGIKGGRIVGCISVVARLCVYLLYRIGLYK